MHTITFSSNPSNRQLPDAKTSLRWRASRFLSQRYAQREQPSVAAEFTLLAVIALTATWSILTAAQAMAIGLGR